MIQQVISHYRLNDVPVDIYYELYLYIRYERIRPQNAIPAYTAWITGGLAYLLEKLFAPHPPAEPFPERMQIWLHEFLQFKKIPDHQFQQAIHGFLHDSCFLLELFNQPHWIFEFIRGKNAYAFSHLNNQLPYIPYAQLQKRYLNNELLTSPSQKQKLQQEIHQIFRQYASLNPPLLTYKKLEDILHQGKFLILEPHELKSYALNPTLLKHIKNLPKSSQGRKLFKQALIALYHETLTCEERTRFLHNNIIREHLNLTIHNLNPDPTHTVSSLIPRILHHLPTRIPTSKPFFLTPDDLPHNPHLLNQGAHHIDHTLSKLQYEAQTHHTTELWHYTHFRQAWLLGIAWLTYQLQTPSPKPQLRTNLKQRTT